MSRSLVDRRLEHARYQRSNGYDPQWVIDNQMGPNPLWMIEALTEELRVTHDMRVLDLGCGTAMTSIFLAREFRARVWATDLWIDAADNAERIEAAGVRGSVTPIHAEAHALPFATGFFDAIVSIDAYHYFGTDDRYLEYLVCFLRAGGRVGIVVPAVSEEIGVDPPAEIAEYWEPGYHSFHSPQWWHGHWSKSRVVHVDLADAIVDGWQDWLRFNEATLPALTGFPRSAAEREIAMLRADGGRRFGFARIVATKYD
jgi:cyclopropane fatty-acyl-phospholipid synthase-like methyltransferase